MSVEVPPICVRAHDFDEARTTLLQRHSDIRRRCQQLDGGHVAGAIGWWRFPAQSDFFCPVTFVASNENCRSNERPLSSIYRGLQQFNSYPICLTARIGITTSQSRNCKGRNSSSHKGRHPSLRFQCATAAAAASSISRPVLNRSSVNPALILCGSSRAMVWAKTLPEPGVALNPPVPQPQLT